MKKKITKRQKAWIERTVDNDRRYKYLLYNRFFIYALSVLLQLASWAIFMYLLHYDSQIAVLAQTLTGFLALVSVVYIINKDAQASLKLGWILVILIAPFFGVPLYLICGDGRPTRTMRRKIEQAKRCNRKGMQEEDIQSTTPTTRAQGLSYCLAKKGGYPAYQDGELVYYDCGEKAFSAMKEALKKANHFILLEYFIIAHGKMWGEILKILLEKAEEGVQIRIIYDDFGCMTTLPPRYDRYLEGLHTNIRCLSFNNVIPVFAVRMNNRDHRKILVIDGETAFTGGFNLADEYIGQRRRFGCWKDTGVKITGGAVSSFVYMFFDIWNAFYGEKEEVENYLSSSLNAYTPPSNGGNAQIIQPYDSSPLEELRTGKYAYLDMVERAAKYVYVFTPYLILDDLMQSTLCRAAMRGVDVCIVTPSIPDKKTVYRMTRANYSILMSAGVKIYEYTPGFIHAKSMLCDGECAVVGTVNLDYRSLYLHFENAVYFANCPAVDELKRDCEETFALSKLCTKESIKRGIMGRFIDSILRIFETLL